MTEVPGQLQRFDFAFGLVEFAQDTPGVVDAPIVHKIEEAFGRYLPLFPQVAQYADEPADRLPYHELFVEAGDNDCEARPGSRQIGHDRFVAFEIVVGHLSKAARFLNFIGRSLASIRCDTYSVPE